MTSGVEQRCEARVGQVLKGKWTLERVLGVGGMAAVYVAQHKIGRREAIKILHPEVAKDAEQRRRFDQEARAANQLQHPGIVEVRDIDQTEDGCPFMVMELLEGKTLSDLANEKGGLEVGETLAYVDEILDVLAVAHEGGIVHRDIKLGNLFLTTEGHVKVLDFGIARLSSSQITRMGARLGTTAYMAPEQVRGEVVDGRADLYAVGATMFRVLAKRRIHEADTEAQLLVKGATQPAPLLATVCDAPAHVCLVVDRALAFRADERYPDARTMRADVQAVRRGEAPPFASSPSPAAAARAGETRAEGTARRAAPPAPRRSPVPEPPASTSAAAFEPTGFAAAEAAPPSVQVRVGEAVDVNEPTGYGAEPASVRDLVPTVVPSASAAALDLAPASLAAVSEPFSREVRSAPFSATGRAVGTVAATPPSARRQLATDPMPADPPPPPRPLAPATPSSLPDRPDPGYAVPGLPPPSVASPQASRRWAPVLAAVGAVLLVVLGIVWALARGEEVPAGAAPSSSAPGPAASPTSPVPTVRPELGSPRRPGATPRGPSTTQPRPPAPFAPAAPGRGRGAGDD